MIKLTIASLNNRPRSADEREFIFVEFNAWLYQGYDDARAALIDVIATKLEAEANARKRGIDKAKDLLKRVNWLRTAKLVSSVAPMFFGLPPIGLASEIWKLGKEALSGNAGGAIADDAKKTAADAAAAASGLLNQKADTSPPKEIQALRDTFEETLDELGVTLVVLIDDLDRYLPETTISTLEAIRLFLFLKNTAFVIAADNEMIKHAVRRHFEGVEDDLLVTKYFDKLIQVPIRVPPLGTQEVRAYMMLLFVENSELDEQVKEKIRAGVCSQLRQTWQGKRVDRAFVQSLHDGTPGGPDREVRYCRSVGATYDNRFGYRRQSSPDQTFPECIVDPYGDLQRTRRRCRRSRAGKTSSLRTAGKYPRLCRADGGGKFERRR
jgi:predicted KAP-like P-loop ATPase